MDASLCKSAWFGKNSGVAFPKDGRIFPNSPTPCMIERDSIRNSFGAWMTWSAAGALANINDRTADKILLTRFLLRDADRPGSGME